MTKRLKQPEEQKAPRQLKGDLTVKQMDGGLRTVPITLLTTICGGD